MQWCIQRRTRRHPRRRNRPQLLREPYAIRAYIAHNGGQELGVRDGFERAADSIGNHGTVAPRAWVPLMTANSEYGDRLSHGTVLHVIHRLGSGVEGVVADYVSRTPGYEHHVLFSPDPTCHDVEWECNTGFASTVVVADNLVEFYRSLRKQVKHSRPDIVHAHSSIAGVAARTMITRIPVVYTPHCYAFMRRDVGLAARALFWSAGSRSSAAACGADGIQVQEVAHLAAGVHRGELAGDGITFGQHRTDAHGHGRISAPVDPEVHFQHFPAVQRPA